jgi:hypothetical protein
MSTSTVDGLIARPRVSACHAVDECWNGSMG